jgi:hypothetical protein
LRVLDEKVVYAILGSVSNSERTVVGGAASATFGDDTTGVSLESY